MYHEFIDEDTTVNERRYKEMIISLQEALHLKSPRMSAIRDWILCIDIFIYLFTYCSLFMNTVSSSDFIALNGRMISE
jgi:hypothetical protein